MSVLVADIETDGLLNTMTKIHCLVCKDTNTGEVTEWHGDSLKLGLNKLRLASEIVMQNGIRFDIPAIRKIYPKWHTKAKITDTLILSRLVYNNLTDIDKTKVIHPKNGYIKEEDFVVWNKKKQTTESAVGRHSLEAWGLRLKCHKGDFGNENDWSTFTPEMLSYCRQDVEVTDKLYQAILKKNYSQDAIDIEMDIAQILQRQIDHGVLFDKPKAERLYEELFVQRQVVDARLQKEFTGWTEEMKTPEYYTFEDPKGVVYKCSGKKELEDSVYADYKGILTRKVISQGIKAGPVRVKHTPFNANSDKHKVKVLKERYNWKPVEFNVFKTGPNIGKTNYDSPKIDVDVLKTLPYKEVEDFIQFDILQDRLEKLLEGNYGYIDACDANNRIHGEVNALGTNTHRCTHSKPNISQVPASYSPFGKQFRELFIVPKGYKIVGSDMAAIEMCCLAHYLYEWDFGEYTEAVSKGKKEDATDAHSMNMRAMGLDDRDVAKTSFYCLIYGGGNAKLSKTSGRDGKEIRENLLANITGFEELVERCKEQHNSQGYLVGLDGRKLYTRKAHSALNVLLQSAGAILAKRWLYYVDKQITEQQLDAKQVIWSHDEIALEVREDQAEIAKDICLNSMKLVEKYYDFKCPLSADASIGESWYDVH